MALLGMAKRELLNVGKRYFLLTGDIQGLYGIYKAHVRWRKIRNRKPIYTDFEDYYQDVQRFDISKKRPNRGKGAKRGLSSLATPNLSSYSDVMRAYILARRMFGDDVVNEVDMERFVKKSIRGHKAKKAYKPAEPLVLPAPLTGRAVDDSLEDEGR